MRRFFRKLNLNKRKIWSVGIIAVIFVMSLGYAALSQHMDIDGVTVIDRNWVVKITGTTKSITGNATENHTYVSNTVTMNVTLPDTSSKVQYSIQIANLGNLVAKLSNIEIIEDDNSSIVYEITGVEEGELIKPNNYDVAVVTIKYADGVTNVGNTEKSIMISFNYVEDVGNSIQGDGYVTVTGQKEYSIGEEVTLVDGSRWYVVNDSGSDEELITLFAANSIADCAQFDTSGSVYNSQSTTNVGYCLNNTYLNDLKSSLVDANGNTSGLAVRLLTSNEYDKLSSAVGTDAIMANKTGQITWLMPNNYSIYVVGIDGKKSNASSSAIMATRPVITILKSNILTSLAYKILADNTEQSDSNIDFSLPSRYPLYGEGVTPTNYTYTHTYSSTANVIYGTGYTFDEKTGKYTLTNGTTVTLGSQSVANAFFSSTYKYTCLSSAVTSCSTIYERAIVSSITSTEAIIIYYKWTSVPTGTYESTNGLYYTSTNTEGDLPTYYFRGAVTNNYVSFAGQTWRIVRINEDGSVRLILNSNLTTGYYNSTYNLNPYIGYMYGTPAANTVEEAHANKNNSTIKAYLDDWYSTNLTRYSEYISTDAGFCNDRKKGSGTMLGTGLTIYQGGARVSASKPQFSCIQQSDLFTTGLSAKGNKDLLYPIGLLTVDELMYAGGALNQANSNYYLYNGSSFWTMTPEKFNTNIYMYYMQGTGAIADSGTLTIGYRPVINLRPGASVVSGGTGTSSNPYVIKTNTDTSLVQQVLSNNKIQSDESIDFSQISSSTNGQGLYVTEKNTEGTKPTHYFRGSVTNNYVSFANKTWRIVRINEDGSIRIVLNGSTGSSVAFNSASSDNAHVGYMYGTVGATSSSSAHTNTTNSIVKTHLDNWYVNNLNNYTGFIADGGFCNDRSIYSGLGYGTNQTYYGAYNRVYNGTGPQFKCPNSSDLFTKVYTTHYTGNTKLTYAIGMLTSDEVVYAGGTRSNSNPNYYLNNQTEFWTMSPNSYMTAMDSYIAYMYYVNSTGELSGNGVTATRYIRPVISLRNGVKITSGNGTSSSPYVIKTS